MSKYQSRIFDPRKGASFEYRVSRSEHFSSLAAGFYILNTWPTREKCGSRTVQAKWRSPVFPDLFRHALEKTSRLLVLIVDRQCGIQPEINLARLKAILTDSSQLVYSEPSAEAMQFFLDLQVKYQTYDEWLFAGCTDAIEVPKESSKWFTQPSGLEFILPQHEKLGCFLYHNGETGEVILGTRIFSGLDAVVEQAMPSEEKSNGDVQPS